jgi:hypothetical protein
VATTTKHLIGNWDTFHNNGPFPTKVLYKTSLETKGNMPSWIDRYNDAAVEIQRLIRHASDSHEGFRAYGSAWSMSHIAHHADNMHYNAPMNLKKAIENSELHPNSNYKHENLFFFQCGNVIKEISRFVFDHGKSLKASGASNGQTIAGCISTGVHGSGIQAGSVQDMVVGLNLIIGPNPEDIVYLERLSQPALNDIFIQSINARCLRDDDLFHAALVGLGAFGFIHGVVLETEDRFLLNRYVTRIKKSVALDLARTLEFANSPVQIPGETDANGKGNQPYHYKVFINPYVNDPDVVVEMIYKKPYKLDYPDPLPRMKTAVYRDLLILFMKIAAKHRNSIPKLIKVLQSAILPPLDTFVTGTLAEIFWDAPYQGPAFACAVGIDHKDSPEALELLTKLARQEGPVPGIYAMRFVRQSPATLAFTQFPVTCMLEIDGLIWKPHNNKMISLEQFATRVIEVLQHAGIPFTIHWGKNADWSFPGLIDHMYGPKAGQWKIQRSALLGQAMCKAFSNKFLDDTGLSEFVPTFPQPNIV